MVQREVEIMQIKNLATKNVVAGVSVQYTKSFHSIESLALTGLGAKVDKIL